MRLNEVTSLTDQEIHTIKQECELFLEESEGRFIYRGIPRGRVIGAKMFTFTPRRHAMDSPEFLHNELNKFFVQHFHMPFRDGLFASGSQWQARLYGQAMIVLPVGDFQYLCYDEINDMYDYWKGLADNYIKRLELLKYDRDLTYAMTDRLIDQLPSLHYNFNRNLPQCISSGSEIMLWCNEYYLIDPTYWPEQ
jgi:hypothetical protein